MNNVPLLDLNKQYEPIKNQVLDSFKEVFDSKQFILGPHVKKLESEVAEYCGVKHAIGVSSGTDALIMALMAIDIKPGDEVITSPFTFFATGGSISRVGATPVFIDIDPETYNLNPKLIEEKINSKTKAIMPVHIFGQLADMKSINEIAKKHNLYVIEDAAQAIGAYTTEITGQPQKAGSIGDLGCFSFFPSKNLGCCGDGGMVTTNNDELAEKCFKLRTHGATQRYYHDFVGGNFRLDSIQAAVLSIKLPLLNEEHTKRRKNADFYNKQLKGVVKPIETEHNFSIYNQYTIQVNDRAGLMDTLTSKNIGNAIYYPVPLHLQKCFESLGYQKGDLPIVEEVSEKVLSIPIFGDLEENQLQYVVETINAFSHAHSVN